MPPRGASETMASAFFKMALCWRSSSFSRRNARFSRSSSCALTPGEAVGGTVAYCFFPASHAGRAHAQIAGRPAPAFAPGLLARSATSRLNSSSNLLPYLLFVMLMSVVLPACSTPTCPLYQGKINGWHRVDGFFEHLGVVHVCCREHRRPKAARRALPQGGASCPGGRDRPDSGRFFRPLLRRDRTRVQGGTAPVELLCVG